LKTLVKIGSPLAALLVAFGAWQWWSSATNADFQQECRRAEQSGNWAKLEEISSAWTRARPNDALPWYSLGQAQLKLGDFTGAANAFKRVPVNGPRGIDAGTALMRLLFQHLNEPRKAVELARQLLELDPRLPDPRRTGIYFYGMTSQRGLLLKDLYAAIKTRADLPEHYVYLITLEDLSFRDGDVVTKRWLDSDPEDLNLKIAHSVQAARIARAKFLTSPSDALRSQMLEVTEQLNILKAESPGSGRILDVLLQSAMDDGDLTTAENLLALVTDDAAGDPVIWFWLGTFSRQTGDLIEAERALRQAVKLHPLGWKSRNELAMVLRASNRSEEAAIQQKLAATGMQLATEIRRLGHVSEVSREILEQIAQYAVQCEDWPVANGIFRRHAPGFSN